MILITGGAGYIGSHCVAEFMKNGFDIVIYDNLSTGHSQTIETLIKYDKNHQIKDFIIGDLKDYNSINEVFKKYKIETVIHFASFSQIGESTQNPLKYYYNNVVGSLNLFSAMIENNVYNVIFSSTASVYGEPKYVPIDEQHPKNPINPYGKSKMFIEDILDDFDKSYGLKSIRLRYFNVVGASHEIPIGENHVPETHLIPNILKTALEKEIEFMMFGTDYNTKDGTCVRDYINIEDLARAHRLAFEHLLKYQKSEVFNIGSSQGYTVKEVFKICENAIGKKINIKECERREGDPEKLIASNKLIKEKLNWQQRYTLEESIKTALIWEFKYNKTTSKIN